MKLELIDIKGNSCNFCSSIRKSIDKQQGVSTGIIKIISDEPGRPVVRMCTTCLVEFGQRVGELMTPQEAGDEAPH